MTGRLISHISSLLYFFGVHFPSRRQAARQRIGRERKDLLMGVFFKVQMEICMG
jgi:hypothetical protein